jgi:hypothetical protein
MLLGAFRLLVRLATVLPGLGGLASRKGFFFVLVVGLVLFVLLVGIFLVIFLLGSSLSSSSGASVVVGCPEIVFDDRVEFADDDGKNFEDEPVAVRFMADAEDEVAE